MASKDVWSYFSRFPIADSILEVCQMRTPRQVVSFVLCLFEGAILLGDASTYVSFINGMSWLLRLLPKPLLLGSQVRKLCGSYTALADDGDVEGQVLYKVYVRQRCNVGKGRDVTLHAPPDTLRTALVEFLAIAIFVLAAEGSVLVLDKIFSDMSSPLGLITMTIVSGLVLVMVVPVACYISGGHIQPVVTLGALVGVMRLAGFVISSAVGVGNSDGVATVTPTLHLAATVRLHFGNSKDHGGDKAAQLNIEDKENATPQIEPPRVEDLQNQIL